MPRYRVRHTYMVNYDFFIDAPTVADSVVATKAELPNSWWPDRGPKSKTKISADHIKYEVQIVEPEKEEQV
jgi:hypothetical protein